MSLLTDKEARIGSMVLGAMAFIFGGAFLATEMAFGSITAGMSGAIFCGGLLLFLKGTMDIEIAELTLKIERP